MNSQPVSTSASERQRTDAVDDDITREAASVSNDSATPPSSGVVPFSKAHATVCPRCHGYVSGDPSVLGKCLPGTRIDIQAEPCARCSANLPASGFLKSEPANSDASSPCSITGLGKGARPPECVPVAASAPEQFVTLCMTCGDVKDGETWRALTDYEGETLRTELGVDITHAVCPQCQNDFMDAARILKHQQQLA